MTEETVSVQSTNPSNGKLLSTFESTSLPGIEEAMSRARGAQADWSEVASAEKRVRFERLADVLKERAEEILGLIELEAGRMRPDAEAELFDVIDSIEYYLSLNEKIAPDTSMSLNTDAFPDTNVSITYEPYGVIALIMPWNFPFYVPMILSIASTVAGNSVVIKPSEYTTMTGKLVGDIFTDAGFPASLVQVVPGGDDTGKLLVKAGPDKIFFVGSIEAGRDIISNAGITPVQVELGGNSAALVLADADLDLAAQGVAWAGTYHSGQDCVGIKRVFVERSVADEFVSKLKAVVSTLRPGVDYGPYISMEARDEVKRRIEDAVSRGAQLLCGAEIDNTNPGNWMTPSVLLIGTDDLELVRKETFGNAVPVRVVESVDAAVDAANATTYGLSNAIFSRNTQAASAVATRLQSGMVFVNDPFIAMPGWDHWTGWRQSGFGTVESKLLQCYKKKVTSVNEGGDRRGFWFPYPTP